MENPQRVDGAFLRRQRLSRRHLIKQAALGGASAATLAMLACGGSKRSPTASNSKSSTPKRGGSATISFNYKQKFDPHVLPADQTQMMGMFYQTLIRNNPKTYALEPEIAAKWELTSPTELVFTLAPNAKWHDKPPANGRPVKADDIIYSYNRVRTNEPRYINKGYLTNIDQMQAVDDHTLKLTLKQPDVTQLTNLTNSGLRILAPEVVEAAKGNVALADQVVGTGAFVLQKSEVNVGSSLLRNPNYYKPGLPYLDSMEIRAFQDFESEWSAFLAGKLDHRTVPGQDSEKFEQQHKGQYALEWFADLGHFIAMANLRRPPFSDARVTRALRLLLDHTEYKNAWANVWYGRGRFSPVFGSATADNWDLTEDEYSQHLEWKQPKDDAIKEALSLLSAAGFSKDKPLKFTLSGTSLDEVLSSATQLGQAQFKRNSQGVVDPTLQLYEIAAWTAVRANGQFDYYIAGHAPGAEDPDAWLSTTYVSGGSRNYGKMSDPQLEQMIAKQRTIFDDKQRHQAIREILLYLIDTCPYSGLEGDYVLNATQPRIAGFPAEGTGYDNGFKWADHYETVWVTK